MTPGRVADRNSLLTGLGGAVLLMLTFTLAVRSGGDMPDRAESAPPVVAVPAQAEAPAEVQPAAADPASATQGLRLRSTLGAGAIFSGSNGGERFVRVGGPAAPGLILKQVRFDHAILEAGGTELRMDLDRFGAVVEGGRMVPPAVAAATPVVAAPRSGQAEVVSYRLGLAPRKQGDRIAGYQLRPGARLPALQKAGLRPGDVLLAVNGQPLLSGEKVEELPQEIAGSYTAEFDFERNGRRMKALLEVNPRP